VLGKRERPETQRPFSQGGGIEKKRKTLTKYSQLKGREGLG